MRADSSRQSDKQGLRQDPVLKAATFAAGCFWGLEQAFRNVPGVVYVIAGYTGGSLEDPTYEQVCTGTTGHAEAVMVTYNPAVISYGTLLGVFWCVHDPTQLNRQGPDIGPQYRSAIFYHDAEQRAEAEASMMALERSGGLNAPVVTQIVPADQFWPAEEYHQRFFDKSRCGTQ